MTLLLALACAKAKDIDGIWAISIPTAASVEEDCSESISHNFTEAYVPDDDEETDETFTEETDLDQSDQLILVQITRQSASEAVMLVGARTYLGNLNEGTWTFKWEGTEDEVTTQTHVDGYDFSADQHTETLTTIRLTKDGDAIKGSWSDETTVDGVWEETDAWSEEITEIGDRGQMPSSVYLWMDVPGAGPRPADNERDRAECSGTNCELEVSSTCTRTRDYTGFITGYESEDAYGHLGAAGQPAGS